ncbi:MAG: cytochrome c [Planctomycetes bacterium]|nr:cytochrome c [Planctomycetota bacterium]
MHARILFPLSLPFLAIIPIVALAHGGSPLKLKVRPPRGKVAAGATVDVRVEVRNRSEVPVTEMLELFLAGGTTPVGSKQVTVGARQTIRVDFEIPLSAAVSDRKIALRAQAGEAESRAWIQTDRRRPPRDDDGDDDDDDDGGGPPSPTDDAAWLAGRTLYTAHCAACHGETGSRIRRESLSEWIEVVARGEEDDDEFMPAFPSLTPGDVAAMRLFANDPDRDVDGEPPPPPPPPPGPSAPTYDVDVQPILANRCTACHNGSFAAGGYAMHTYATAFANRAQIVDSAEKDRMPPSAPLPAAEKATLRAWLDGGAPQN